MVERVVPPKFCRNICANAGTRGCVEVCAVNRQAEKFIPADISLKEAPPFPIEDFIYNATPKERTAINAFYVGKLTERFQDPKEDFDDEDWQTYIDEEKWYDIINKEIWKAKEED